MDKEARAEHDEAKDHGSEGEECNSNTHASVLWVLWLLNNFQFVCLGVFLNLSEVACLGHVALASSELLLEQVNVSLLHWVDGPQDVPVNECVAWWGGDGSFVNPSVSGVHHSHELAVCYLWHDGVGECLIPLEGVEEIVDHFNLPVCKLSSVVVD